LAQRNVAQSWIQRENWQFETHKFSPEQKKQGDLFAPVETLRQRPPKKWKL
jgi:hypothetical protein